MILKKLFLGSVLVYHWKYFACIHIPKPFYWCSDIPNTNHCTSSAKNKYRYVFSTLWQMHTASITFTCLSPLHFTLFLPSSKLHVIKQSHIGPHEVHVHTWFYLLFPSFFSSITLILFSPLYCNFQAVSCNFLYIHSRLSWLQIFLLRMWWHFDLSSVVGA